MNENLRILIADDSILMRMVMRGFFKKLLTTPAITECGNLPEAFALLGQQSFDLLLLDINMPKGDSNPETVREILAIQPDLKICMFSGNDKNMLEPLYKATGAVGFIQKDDEMSSVLEKLLQDNFS